MHFTTWSATWDHPKDPAKNAYTARCEASGNPADRLYLPGLESILGHPEQPRKASTNVHNEYLKEKINFGGEMKSRGEVMTTMQKEGHSQQNIDRYMQGTDNAKEIDESKYVETCLLQYENITAKIRMYWERPPRHTYNRHTATALDRAHKAYRALTTVLKPTLAGWKKK